MSQVDRRTTARCLQRTDYNVLSCPCIEGRSGTTDFRHYPALKRLLPDEVQNPSLIACSQSLANLHCTSSFLKS
jgi:hypothetical protein